MTMISVLRTPTFVVIASDRLLSYQDGTTSKRDAVKNVLFFNDMVLGYTGLAKLKNNSGHYRDTDLWLTEVLIEVGERSVIKAIELIAQRAEESFARIYNANPQIPICPLAFIGIGWERDTNDPSKVSNSILTVISNYYRPSNVVKDGIMRILPGKPGLQFTYTLDRVSIHSDEWLWGSIGTSPSIDERDWFDRKMNVAAHNDNNGGVKDLTEIMKNSIRQTSQRLGKRIVGSDILVAILPAEAAASDTVLVIGPQAKGGIIFCNGDKPTTVVGLPYSSFVRYTDGRNHGFYICPRIVATGFDNFGFTWVPREKRRHNLGFTHEVRTLNDSRNKVVAVTDLKTHRANRRKRKR